MKKLIYHSVLKRSIAIGILFIMYFSFNFSTNKHFHVLPSGIVISHAHSNPLGQVHQNNHDHSDSEFSLLQMLDNCSILFLSIFVFVLILPSIKRIFISLKNRYSFFSVIMCQLRGPPSLY